MLFIFILIGSAGAVQPAWADGPYRGKVIDADTKVPIEGAVVVAVWLKNQFGITESHEVFAEAKEALTDKDGEFVIPGYKWTSIFFYFGIQPPRIYIFKAGYGDFPWHQVSPNPKQSNAALLEPFKTHAIVELPRLITREERLDVLHNYHVCCLVPREKIPSLIKMENIERKNLGMDGEMK
jgi:hypothetical protein